MKNQIVLRENEILVLRDCKHDMTSHNNFVWPVKGAVEAPDWKSDFCCGHGLHGLPWGVGGNYFIGGVTAKYLVVRVCTDTVNYCHGQDEMTDKCKFHHGFVEFCGTLADAVALISKYMPVNTAINFSTQTAGNESTQTAGYRSTQTAGYASTQTAEYMSTQTAGNESTQTAEYASTQTAGNRSTQTAGNESTQTAGNASTQTAGDESTQTAGNESTQKAGDRSTQTAGDESTQKAGDKTVQICRWYKDGEWKVSTRVITTKEADKWYRFDGGEWTPCTATEIAEAEKKTRDA